MESLVGQKSEAYEAEKAAWLLNRLNIDDRPKWGVGTSSVDSHHPPQFVEPKLFTLFPKLPTELRLRIWELACHQPWVFYMNISEEKFEFLNDLPPFPAALHANSEARAEGLSHGTIIERCRLDRGPAEYEEEFGPWPTNGRPPRPVPVPAWLPPPPGQRRRLHPRVKPCVSQFFYTNFASDMYVLSMDNFTKAYPVFRLQGDFYRPGDVPTALGGAPFGYTKAFPAFEDAIIPPIFGNIHHLVLDVSLERTLLSPNNPLFTQWIARASRRFIGTYVMSTILHFPRVESISFLIQRQPRAMPTSLGFPFDGDQELREMDQVPILPENSLCMGADTLRRLEIEFRNVLWKVRAIEADPIQSLKFVMKVPKSLPRKKFL